MKVCLYTIDFFKGRERLMPWRTLIEVARFMKSIPNWEVCVVSGQEHIVDNWNYDSVEIISISKGLFSLKEYVLSNKIDALFFPVSFRDGLKSMSLLGELPIIKVAYVPGGIYPLNGVLSFTKLLGFSKAYSYILETLVPKFLLVNKLRKYGVNSIISFSDFTKRKIVHNGFPKELVYSAIPGLDNFLELDSDSTIFDKLNLRNKRFILFSGAPAPIRGASLLLDAFERFAENNEETHLVLLMRTDVHSDFSFFKKKLASIKCKERIIVCYDKLSPKELKSFFEQAYLVALPFILIPSEIPLTYFEVLGCGTPIITFENGGTTEYVQNGAVIASERSSRALADGMLRICNDYELRAALSKNARELMNNHPSWEQFARIWIDVIKKRFV